MTLFVPTRVTCPGCHTVFDAEAPATLNTTRMPWMRSRILAGDIHRARCPECGVVHRLECPFLYSDFEAPCLIMVHLPNEVVRWRECEEMTLEATGAALTDAPEDVEVLFGRLAIRSVFGLVGLQEKLRIWGADLDDAVVELLKLELFASMAKAAGGRDADGRIYDRDIIATEIDLDNDVMRFEARPWSTDNDAAAERFEASLERYRTLFAHRGALAERYPRLFHQPWVSFRRIALERHGDKGNAR